MMIQNSSLSIIRCGVGPDLYGLDMDCIRSIEQTEQMQWEAGELGLAGYLQTARERIPVYSLGQRLGQPLTATAETQRVVVLEGKRPFALLVDRVSSVTQVRPEQVRPMPLAVVDRANDYFDGLVQLHGQFLPLLAADQLRPDAQPRPQTAVWPQPQPRNGQPQPTNARYQPQVVIFTIPNMPTSNTLLAFALSLSQVPEIRDPLPPRPLPHAPAPIVGLVEWQGEPVPLLNLAHYWQPEATLPPWENGRLRLLIAHTAIKEIPVALFVEPNVQLEPLPLPNQPAPLPPAINPALIRGSVYWQQQQLLVPDLLKMLETARRM